jgi:16S rRNA G966 N2-methylase RsmD
MQNQIHFGDNLPFLQKQPRVTIDLIYIDPPFNTGKMQSRRQLKTTRSDAGDRIGLETKAMPLRSSPPAITATVSRITGFS